MVAPQQPGAGSQWSSTVLPADKYFVGVLQLAGEVASQVEDDLTKDLRLVVMELVKRPAGEGDQFRPFLCQKGGRGIDQRQEGGLAEAIADKKSAFADGPVTIINDESNLAGLDDKNVRRILS